MTTQTASPPPSDVRFSGHQTFALRISWLSKAAEGIERGVDPLGDPINGVVELGLGKVMVESLRCWAEAYGVAERVDGVWRLTEEGALIFGAKGRDRYLEDLQTLWWLHWKISTLRTAPLFAWELLVNRWNEPTFTPSQVIAAFAREAERAARTLSDVTMKQHLDVWVRTYCAPKEGRLQEDGLDCPLAFLGLVRHAGERDLGGRSEPVYAFDLGPKRGVSQALFAYCLTDWWQNRPDVEDTAPFYAVATGSGSPGRVLRMPEREVRERLQLLQDDPRGAFELKESLNQYQVIKRRKLTPLSQLLAAVYAPAARPQPKPAHV